MDRKRPVYVPVEMPYHTSPLEEMLETAVAIAGRRLDAPVVEFVEGSSGNAAEIIVSRECVPRYGLSPSYRKWLTVPTSGIECRYGHQSEYQRPQSSDSAMPIADDKIQYVLTSPALLRHEAVLFRLDPWSMDFANLPLLDGTKENMLNDYYAYPDSELLREVWKHLAEPNRDFTEMAKNCLRLRHRGSGMRLSDYAARVLMDEITAYAFSSAEESSL